MSNSSEYFIYTTAGHETLTGVCNSNQCRVAEVIRINPQSSDQDGLTVGQILTEYQISGKPLPSGLSIRIPYSNTGGLDTAQKRYNVITDAWLQDRALSGSRYSESNRGRRTITDSQLQGLNSTLKDWKTFNCFVAVYKGGSLVGQKYLPIYPNEFSDSNSASFNGVNLFGRSVDYQIYQGSSRDVNLTLSLHEELCSDYNYIHTLVAFIESANYPEYSTGHVQPPEIRLTIGKHLQIRGILTSCSANWKAPIIDGKLVNCDLAIGIKETTGPYAMSTIRSKGGHRT